MVRFSPIRTIFDTTGLPLQVGHRAHDRLFRSFEESNFVGSCGAD